MRVRLTVRARVEVRAEVRVDQGEGLVAARLHVLVQLGLGLRLSQLAPVGGALL